MKRSDTTYVKIPKCAKDPRPPLSLLPKIKPSTDSEGRLGNCTRSFSLFFSSQLIFFSWSYLLLCIRTIFCPALRGHTHSVPRLDTQAGFQFQLQGPGGHIHIALPWETTYDSWFSPLTIHRCRIPQLPFPFPLSQTLNQVITRSHTVSTGPGLQGYFSRINSSWMIKVRIMWRDDDKNNYRII